MKKFLLTSLSLITIVSISGCTTAPNPEEICTSEWISKRSTNAIGKIESKAGRSIKALTKAAESWSKGKTPSLFQMLALQNAFKGLEKELTSGVGMKDLRTLSKTCNDPQIVSDAMGNLLRKQNLPDNVVNFIENFEPYQRLIRQQIETQKIAYLLTP